MEYFDDFKSNRDKQIMVFSILFFLIAFPSYFAMAAHLKGADSLGDNVEGDWLVLFNETTTQFGAVENDMINDQESKNYQWNTDAISFEGEVAMLKMTLTYDETDESGNGGQPECDTIDVTINMGAVDGAYSDVTDSLNQCGLYEWYFQVIPGYDGDVTGYEGVTKSQIESYWDDGDNGTGMVDVTIGVRANTADRGLPGNADNNNEQGESISVKFEIVTFELEIIPFVEEEWTE